MAFQLAARRNAKLRLALDGVSGSGKTWTLLQFAKAFSDLPAVIDSERGSSEKYAHKAGTTEGPGNWRFLKEDVDEKNPDGYLRIIREAAAAGHSVLGIDSYSHAWIGTLEKVDAIGGNKFAGGWRVMSPKVTKLVDSILSYPGHVIVTMRAHTEYVVEENEKGKKEPRKVGLAPVARKDTEYEFDVMLNLSLEGTLTVSKSRCTAVPVGSTFERDEIPALIKTLKDWLDEGAPVPAWEGIVARIRLAESLEALRALAPEIQALSDEDRALVKPHYVRRKTELTAESEEIPE